jgi:microcystin-dependent protein
MDLQHLRASDGTGEAVLAHVQSVRTIGSTVLELDNIDNWNSKCIVVTGTPNANGYIDSAGMTIMYGHTSAGDFIIDGYAPGYADAGNTTTQVAIVKMTTNWADTLVTLLETVINDDGSPKTNIANPVGTVIDFAGRTAPSGWLLCYGQAVSRATYADLFAILNPSVGTFTITIASPGVVTLNSHELQTGDALYLTTTGALPTGLAANTRYFAIRIDANTVRLATSYANAIAGTAINTSGSQSGVHTLRACPYGLGDGSTTFNLPDLRGRVIAGNDIMGGTSADRLTAPSTANSLNGDVLGNSGGSQTHTILTAELAAHTHTIANVVQGAATRQFGAFGADSHLTQASGVTDSRGSDTPHNNVQPTLIMNKIIKT